MQNRFTLTLLVLVALTGPISIAVAWPQAETPPAEESQETAQPVEQETVTAHNEEALGLLRQARSELFKRESIQADMSQRATLGNYRFVSSGKYLAGTGFRTRVEYFVELGDMQGQFLEVCDGQILHTRREISKKQPAAAGETPQIELSRRDIQKILKETQQYLDLSEPKATAAMRAAEIGIGGLPAMLASLERTFLFDEIRYEEENGMPVAIIQGHWNTLEQETLQANLGTMMTQVVQFLPDRVLVTFRTEDSFPVRIQYLKQLAQDRKAFRPILTLDFSNIQLDKPIPTRAFSYLAPPGMEERDETAVFIETIKLAAGGSEEASTENEQAP